MISELDKEILKKIVASEKPLNGAELSNMCHISINTLRKEIIIINDFLADHGCYIDTKIAIGYSLVIENAELANTFLYQLIKNINRYGYLNISDFKKENYIIRRLLSSNSMVSIDTLMNELYCSKSTILRNIDRTKEYLSKFNLEIKAKRNVGIYIEGKEWDKRLCLIHQHKIQRHSNYSEPINESAFNALFLNNTNYPYEVRNLFISHASLYKNLTFSHIDLPTIFNFMILLKTRQNKSNEFNFTEDQINTVRNSPTYLLVNELYESLPVYIKEGLGQIEIDALSILMFGLRKYNHNSELSEDEIIRLKQSANEIINFVCKRIDIKFMVDDQLVFDLCCLLKEQENQRLCCVYRDDETFYNMVNKSLLTADITARVAYYMNKYHNIKMTADTLGRIYFIFNRAAYENRPFFDKQKFLVISRYSNYYSNNLTARIKNHFKFLIEKIDTCEYFDIALVDLSQYDAVITDISNRLISTGMPTIEITYTRSSDDFEPLKEYFKNIYLKKALNIFKEKDYSIFNFNNKEEIYETIYSSLDNPCLSKEEWIKDCKERQEFITFEREKGIVLITNHSFNNNQPIFKMFISNESIIWDKHYSNIFIYYHLGNGTNENQQIISFLIKQFLYAEEQYLTQLPTLNYEDIISNFKENKTNGLPKSDKYSSK